MKYTTQDNRFTDSRLTAKRSVAESLLETIYETLGQDRVRPGLSKPAGRRRRARQIAGGLAMLVGLAALGLVSLRPEGEQPAGGKPVAFIEIARGRAEMLGSGRGASPMLMLAGGEPIHAGAVIETAATAGNAPAGRAAVRLAGGQSMRLDGGSRVRFASSSSVVLESGAVYVDSAGASSVEVRTALGVVRDIGTRFEVRLLGVSQAATSLQVRVREGSIMLESGEESHHAVAGEELLTAGDGNVTRGPSPVYGPRWDWVLETATAPDIADRPLQDFLDWVERESGRKVRFADQATANLAAGTILHGEVRDLTLAEASAVVLHGSGLDYRLEDGTFIVEPRKEEIASTTAAE